MKQRYKAMIAAMIGNALEYYDVMLYGFFATMLAPLFFPTSDTKTSLISSLGIFAAGFIMRPLGGVVFGHLGDRFGRRFALGLTIVLVTVPTFTIGILPTYASIGITAPIILVFCRLLQGLCVGGEYSGASVFVVEHSKKGREAFATSVLCAAGFLGGVLGTFLGFICTLSFMPGWAWRIPFLIGAVIGLVGYRLRTQIDESPAFLRHKDVKVEKIPLIAILREKKRNLLCTVGIGATSLIPFYMASVYMGYLLSSELHILTSKIMLINVGLNIFIMLLLPFMGMLADKVGKEKLMLGISTFSILLSYPLFAMLEKDLNLTNIILAQGLLGFITAGFGAPSTAFISNLFPVQERYSALGFGYALGGALLGGTTPLILASLTNWLNVGIGNTFYLMLSGFIGLSCVLFAEKNNFNTYIYEESLKMSA